MPAPPPPSALRPAFAALLACCLAFLTSSPSPLHAQTAPSLKNISRSPAGDLLLRAEPQIANPNDFLLQSSDSPGGPWWPVPGQTRTPVSGGYDFLAPFKSWQLKQFYRLSPFNYGTTVPAIRYLAPNDFVRPGLSVTLLGKNFAPQPAGNTVTFTFPGLPPLNAAVTAASSRHLEITVPAALELDPGGAGRLYRVTVTTAAGESNGVGCNVWDVPDDTFKLRPSSLSLLLPPGTGKESLILGGGTPPYRLVPQTPAHAAIATAVLNGKIVDLTAPAGSAGGLIEVTVEDSSTPPIQSSSLVSVLPVAFTPSLFAQFHTTLAGTAPGCSIFSNLPGSHLILERTEIRLLGATLETATLQPGTIPAVVKYSSSFASETVFAFMEITSKEPGRANFELIVADGGRQVLANGAFVENPPAVIINSKDVEPASVMAVAVDQEILFADRIFRLPATAATPFALAMTCTSVSASADLYAPQQSTQTQNLVTSATLGPRLERVIPVEAQVSACVDLIGTGMAADSTVTFASENGRVPAVIKERTATTLTVVVPPGANTAGPIIVTSGGHQSNGFHFAPRFHPDATLTFTTFKAGTLTPLRLIFHQFPDNFDTEVGIGRIICTLDKGAFDFSSLTDSDPVGTIKATGQLTGSDNSLDIFYTGPEPGTSRHIFESTFTRFYLSNAPGGAGVILELELTEEALRTELAWDCAFTTALYRPPSPAGTPVNMRLEILSKPWRGTLFPPLNVVKNIRRNVQP